jgi:tetratricopeptide (TPR) repeat protein
VLLNVMFVLALTLAPTTAYNKGNALYAQRDYAGAAAAYAQALAAGPNASAHYNLGNAQFKSGKIGQAILHYRRARFLAPRDADVRANLAFARSYRVDKVLTAQGPVATALDAAFHRLSRREAALATAILFALGALALAAWIVRRWTAALAASLAFGLLALYGFANEQAWARGRRVERAKRGVQADPHAPRRHRAAHSRDPRGLRAHPASRRHRRLDTQERDRSRVLGRVRHGNPAASEVGRGHRGHRRLRA